MVSLAKKNKDKPFHLIASYCQGGAKEQVLAALKADGWSDEMANFTVERFTMFKDGVKKGKYIPYYFIFDHTGKLRYHHQAGPWHGGDGDKYQKLVAKLIAEIPKEKSSSSSSKPLTALRSWKNNEGKTLRAQLLEVKDGKGKFRKANGSVFWYELNKLSQENQAEIKKLQE